MTVSHHPSKQPHKQPHQGGRGKASRILVAAVCLGVAATFVSGLPGTTAANAAGTTLHVSTRGLDSNPGSATRPFRSIQRAVDAAAPGSQILVHAGVYAGKVTIRKSGTAAAPIQLAAAGDGAVTMTSSPAPAPCNASQPASERTLRFEGGADHWTVRGMAISGGVIIVGERSNAAYTYMNDLVRSANWQARRAVPGRGVNDPVAARNALSYISQRVGRTINPSDGIALVDNTITRRGVYVGTGRYGRIEGNRITSIDCGTGPGIWLQTLSDGWSVTGNHVSKVARSTHKHFMQEGIRLGMASNYNLVQDNVVEDLEGDGRAFNTDVDASWNTFRGNTARNVAMGYNEQKGGWGNRWLHNRSEGARVYGFAFRLADGRLARPSMDTSSNAAVVECNRVTGVATHLYVGGARKSTFAGNGFSAVGISKNAREYWGIEGNRYNGSAVAPPPNPPVSLVGCAG
jgi:hypothetical protein